MMNRTFRMASVWVCFFAAFSLLSLSGCVEHVNTAMNLTNALIAPSTAATVPGGTYYGGADPDAFLARSKASEALIDKSADSLFNAVASKEEQAKIEEMKKKLNETTDDKEKNAIRQQITESEIASIEKASQDKALKKQAKKYDEKKKKQIADSFYNFSLGSMQAALLVPEGTRIATAISGDPTQAIMLAIKISSVWEAVSSLKGIITNTGKVIVALKPVMSAAKIDAQKPTSAAEKPREIEGGI